MQSDDDRGSSALESVINQLVGCFPNAKTTPGTIAVYAKMLADIPTDLLQRAADKIIASEQFFPTVALLRQTALALSGSALPSVEEAWEEVVDALQEVSRRNMAHRPNLSNPLAQQIADALGWRRLYLYQDMYRKDFFRAYSEAAERETNDRLLPASVRREIEHRGKYLAAAYEGGDNED